MIQIHGKTIFSMEFKSIIKTIIQSHGKLFIKIPILTSNIKKSNSHWQHQAQFPLAISKSQVLTGNIKKPNSHWQYMISQKRIDPL